jgi:hypothetical protein
MMFDYVAQICNVEFLKSSWCGLSLCSVEWYADIFDFKIWGNEWFGIIQTEVWEKTLNS